MHRNLVFTFLITLVVTVFASGNAYAQEPAPGDSCAGYSAGAFQRAGGPEVTGGSFLVCDGSNWVSFLEYQDSGQSLFQVGNDTTACTAEKDGRIRYVSASDPPWQYCDGGATTWTNFKQPRCQDDDTGECYLDATRSNDDPDFVAANIANSINILGVTGTFTGSACGVFNYTFDDKYDVGQSTVIESNRVQITTDSCSAEVLISGGGTPEYRICDDAACSTVDHTWATSGNSIDNGQYLELRLTSPATADTAHTASVTVGAAMDEWLAKTAPTSFTVFVTSTNLGKDLGGIGRADYECNQRAIAAGLGQNFKAWLSEGDLNFDAEPRDRFHQSSLAYRLVDGTKVADDWTDLTDGTLDNAISLDETGSTISSGVLTYTSSTGAAAGGGFENASCDNWTLGVSVVGRQTYRGQSTATNADWTYETSTGCAGSAPIYCFQQPDDPVGAHKKVFVTASTFDGNLGGVSGADSKCQTEANNAALSGTYKAWITGVNASSEPSSRFTQAGVPYRMVDGTRIADDWADLIDGALTTGIHLTAAGGFISFSSGRRVFSNTNTDGTQFSSGAFYTCNDWGSSGSFYDAKFGYIGYAGGYWTISPNTYQCTGSYRLYCFEQ